MREEGDHPMIGHVDNDRLGVREKVVGADGKERGDIKPVEGIVYPETGGMSVGPSKDELPPHLIPKRLRRQEGPYYKAARSNNKPETFPWRMGEGPFITAPFCDGLHFRPDPNDPQCHGLVEPNRPMPLGDYRAAIETTHPDWAKEQW
jgi:hypothetical protein